MTCKHEYRYSAFYGGKLCNRCGKPEGLRERVNEAAENAAEFLSLRLGRVARIVGVKMPEGMSHAHIAERAGTILGDIARKLEANNDAADARRYRFAMQAADFAICRWDDSDPYSESCWRPVHTNEEIDAAMKQGEMK